MISISNPTAFLVSDVIDLRLAEVANLSDTRKHTKVLRDFRETFGSLPWDELKPYHARDWLNAHRGWKQSARSLNLTRLRTAFNSAKRLGYIDRNPIDGYRVPGARSRCTYFDEHAEQLIYQHANAGLRQLARVLIATGMRPGEATTITADMVRDDGSRMMLILPRHKNRWKGKKRFVIPPPEICDLLRVQIRKFPRGSGEPLLRTLHGKRWKGNNATDQFHGLMHDLKLHAYLQERFGSDVDPPCLYSCRHTAATRLIARVGLATSAELLGNTVKVLERTYKHIECLQDHLYRAMGH